MLEMLVSEADRRVPAIVNGLRASTDAGERDPDGIEEIRVDAHGLKGAAMVVGQDRLSELARQMEVRLVECKPEGTVGPELADALVGAASAFLDGARAAAESRPEPPAVAETLASLSGR